MMPYVAIREYLKDQPAITDLGVVLDKWPAEPNGDDDPNGTPEAFDHGFMLPCFYPAITGMVEHPTEAWQGLQDSWVPVHFFAPTTDLLDQMRSALHDALHKRKLDGVLDGHGWTSWAGDGIVRDKDPFPDMLTDYSRFRVTVRRDTVSPDY